MSDSLPTLFSEDELDAEELMFLHTILPTRKEPSPWESGNMKRNLR